MRSAPRRVDPDGGPPGPPGVSPSPVVVPRSAALVGRCVRRPQVERGRRPDVARRRRRRARRRSAGRRRAARSGSSSPAARLSAGSGSMRRASEKFAPVIGSSEVTTSCSAEPHSRSSPAAVQISSPSSAREVHRPPRRHRVAAGVARVGVVVVEARPRRGRARRRRRSRRRGPAPDRVSATTTLRAPSSVSSVPNVPIVGLATIQSPVSFGQPGTSVAAAVNAWRSMLAVPADDLLAGQAVDVGDRRAGEELQVVDLGGPARRRPCRSRSSTRRAGPRRPGTRARRRRARAAGPRRARRTPASGAERAERGMPERGQERLVGRRAARRTRSAPVAAAVAPVARLRRPG